MWLYLPRRSFCQRDCYRREFAGKPVRIAELQRWVCAEAGEDGWIKSSRLASGHKVAVIGGGPSALSCGYYLTHAGCEVKVFAPEDRPGGKLWERASSEPLLKAAVERDIRGLMSSGIEFQGGQTLGENLDLNDLLETCQAVYLTDPVLPVPEQVYSVWSGHTWQELVDGPTNQIAGHPKIFIGEEFLMNGITVVEAAARGRKAATDIWQFLNSMGN